MKTFICVLILFSTIPVFSQTVSYTYDAAGNRTARVITLAKAPQAPVEDETVTALPDLIAKKTITIYPNPTKGIITVEIEDYDDETKAEFRLTDMSGRKIFDRKADSGNQTLDLSRQASGIYLLQVRINGESTVWKIIKE